MPDRRRVPKPLPVARSRDPFESDEISADDDRELPRRPRRNQPIYEDDPRIDDIGDPITDWPTRRRVRESADDGDIFSPVREESEDMPADTVDDFGSDPNKDLAEEPRPKRR